MNRELYSFTHSKYDDFTYYNGETIDEWIEKVKKGLLRFSVFWQLCKYIQSSNKRPCDKSG